MVMAVHATHSANTLACGASILNINTGGAQEQERDLDALIAALGLHVRGCGLLVDLCILAQAQQKKVDALRMGLDDAPGPGSASSNPPAPIENGA